MSKPHAVCIPFPEQGHINPTMKLAKLLHQRGFHITFVNTHFNHSRILKSRGPNSLDGLPDFRFESIPDGLPPAENKADATQDIPSLCGSLPKFCLDPFRKLITELNDNRSGGVPPVSCVVSDGCMSFTIKAAEEFGIPVTLFYPFGACGFMGFLQYRQLLEKGIIPFKDESYFTNGYLDTTLDWIPGMKNIRLKDLPTLLRITDRNDTMFNFIMREVDASANASAILFNSFHPLEHKVLEALSPMIPRQIYTAGPIHLLVQKTQPKSLSSIKSNLWKEELECLEWLNSKDTKSVIYVNFGSITPMTPQQLVEFAWGLANSEKPFIWIIRPDIIDGNSAIIPTEFVEETKERCMISSWCPQEEVLNHPAIGGFLSHCGWNSTLESLSAGVPIIGWPFFAEQQTNCWFLCSDLGVGMAIDTDVKRDEVEKLVRELIDGEKGKEMREKAMEWKRIAEEVTEPGGSSLVNLDKMIQEVLLAPLSKP
ncbi:7-deoxyloganetin glucosyltransferase-like [Humulus lupulus]|uniref:7-deoxyloganetin glucosyltransferase-like n=1 Tax=Humulus lupulus TaxID=3486 RepID=UPI002B413031|nr:7-deoxyloganetin glucosyltransferase-like [Humulus lupulus]